MTQYSGPERIKNDAPRFWRVESITGATDTWTADDSGTLFLLNRAGGIDITLPSLAAADDVGIVFKVLCQTTVTDDYTFTAAAGDLLAGAVLMVDTDTGDAVTSASPDGSDDLVVTLNGDSTGGLVGSWLLFESIGTAGWLVTGVSRHSGDVATPFS